MKKKSTMHSVILLLFLSFFVSCSKDDDVGNEAPLKSASVQGKVSADKKRNVIVTVTEFATNIACPRGLKFGPDGYLYVASAGSGGTNSTAGLCGEDVLPMVQSLSGNTGKIIKISPDGTVSTVVDNLPSGRNGFGDVQGPSDVEFIGNDLYALLVAGCSHGTREYPSAVLKVNTEANAVTVVADLSAYFHNNPVASPDEDDFEPDGTPYSMVNVRGDLYIVEPNHGELIKSTTSGEVSRVVDFSAHYGHIVPTATAYNGNFFVGNLRTFPLVEGSSNIYKVTPGGQVKIRESGFTGVLGVAFDKNNRMYVLETSQAPGPAPMTGRVIRVNEDETRNIVVDNLFFPTAMTFCPDGALYISNMGFGPPTGQILKVVFNSN